VDFEDGVTGLCFLRNVKKESGKRMEDMYSPGQEIQVRLDEVDVEARKVAVSMYEEGRDPNSVLKAAMESGEFIKSVVKTHQPFGAFVEVEGVRGLLHISKMTEGRLDYDDMVNMFPLESELDVKVESIQKQGRDEKISFKITESSSPPTRNKRAKAANFGDYDSSAFREATVVSVTDFGAFCSLGEGFEGMLHASEVPEYVDDMRNRFSVGDVVSVRIANINADQNQIRLSQLEEGQSKPRRQGGSRKKDISQFIDADVKEYIAGKVASITDFGAFVNLAPGVDGLLHISKISEGMIDTVEEVLKVGDDVQVRVLDANPATGKISLAMTPYTEGEGRVTRRGDVSAFANYDYNEFIPGTISKTLMYGAFVTLAPGVEGFLHISQLKEGMVDQVTDVVREGDEVQVRITYVDEQDNKIDLTMLPPMNKGGGRKGSSDFAFEFGGEEGDDWENFSGNLDDDAF